ncbi:50S ribosome-binding GTPase [Brucepastera parasyntrophica]|uniref:GTP-binding protein n=1 Tax=Brucepastera parasyntrophica TaxID=2880008 RepID=UPI00210AA2B4|nr:GTPase [Brucepastera parasyntrophica]ULQ59807.1 50S ribosome-binding GTPase [Brucepastera parasyntrophica]
MNTGNEQLTEILKNVQDTVRALASNINQNPAGTIPAEHETISKIEELLEQNDFTSSYIRNICARAKSSFSLDQLNDFDQVQETVLGWIGESLSIYESPAAQKPHVIALVGPTGVGKTTTIAKLAAAYGLAYKKTSAPLNVRVITIDNYRIGAKKQLEKYGEIMEISISCAENPEDLRVLVENFQDADVILIDTTGRSPRDYLKIGEMRQFFDVIDSDLDVYLVMSATTKTSDMREIMQQYETFGYKSVIVSKFDETARVGNIISVLSEKRKPVSYLTTGQRVPKDFEQATVIRFLTNLGGFHVQRARIDEMFPGNENRFEWR